MRQGCQTSQAAHQAKGHNDGCNVDVANLDGQGYSLVGGRVFSPTHHVGSSFGCKKATIMWYLQRWCHDAVNWWFTLFRAHQARGDGFIVVDMWQLVIHAPGHWRTCLVVEVKTVGATCHVPVQGNLVSLDVYQGNKDADNCHPIIKIKAVNVYVDYTVQLQKDTKPVVFCSSHLLRPQLGS